MKKSVIALSVAAALGGLASIPASAQVPQAGDDLFFNPAGVGHILIVPYFTTQAGNSTKINIYNTDTINGKALKVRFRGASNSDDVYDFQVFLSPGDVWTASIDQNTSGLSTLTTSDKSCTVPSSVSGAFITGRLNPNLTGDALANETREGYVEILNMGDVSSVVSTALFNAVKHKDGVAPCTRSILDSLAIYDTRLALPTSGLMANWIIVNVPNTTTFSGEAAAIEARTSLGVRTVGKNVYWPQRADSATPINNTADPLFLTGAVTIAQYDLPDLSTPYTGTGNCPFCQANRLSHSMSSTRAAGEYLSDPGIGATTDWVVSMPTRRYYAAVDYDPADPDVDYDIVTNHDDFLISEAVYFRNANTQLGNAVNGGKEYQICTQVTSIGFWNREEGSPLPDGPVISPGQPKQPPWLCGEVSVVGINSPVSPLGASVARTNVTVAGFVDGWGNLQTLNTHTFNGTRNFGLPMLVWQFSKGLNPAAKPGVSGTYGVNFPGRIIDRGAEPE